MPEMFSVNDADTGAQLRKFRSSNPVRALALGYAYVAKYPDRDFVVRDEAGNPVPASRCKAIFLARGDGHRSAVVEVVEESPTPAAVKSRKYRQRAKKEAAEVTEKWASNG